MLKIICLKGGVGNQIFEYCRYRQLKDAGHRTYLHYDRRKLKQHHGQRINQIFNITLPAEPWWITLLAVTLKVLRFFNVSPRLYDDELPGCVLIDCYCQERAFTLNAREVLRFRQNLLTDEAELVAGLIREAPHAAAIHVRRGDYLHACNIRNFGTCSPAYYAAAMERVRSLHADVRFFLFSDDVAWCKEQPVFAGCHITDLRHSPDYVSMYLMTMCRSHIIANSTFSFWGAFLATHNDGTNIYPRRWYANETWVKPDFLPASWIALD